MLKVFIRGLRDGKHLRTPTQDEQDAVAHKIAVLFAQAEQLGKTYASKQLGEDFMPKFVGKLLDRAADFVGRSINWSGQLFDSKVEALGDDAEDADIEQALTDTAETVAQTLAPTEIQDVIEQTVLDTLQGSGVEQIAWIASPDACEMCQQNAEASPLPIGQEWPSGHTTPPAHHRCRCHIETV